MRFAGMGDIGRFWVSFLDPLVLLLPSPIELGGFSIFQFWAYRMKVIPEIHLAR